MIYEDKGLNLASRIRIHQTSLANINTDFTNFAGYGFICTNPLSDGGSILLDGAYFHCLLSNVIDTLFNRNATVTDNMYANSLMISAGTAPDGNLGAASWQLFPSSTTLLLTGKETINPY